MDLRKILENPFIYTTYQRLVGGYRARRLFVENHVNAKSSQKILDVGCGPGYMLEFLPELNYTGIDIDNDYIKKAQSLYGEKAKFICAAVEDVELDDPGTYDIVTAAGILHHLDDDSCIALFQLAKKALKPNGYFVSMDGCFRDSQSEIARFFLKKDRGEYVRNEGDYIQLASNVFDVIDSEIDETYFRIPYTSILMKCQ